jgi:hypothetical protein
VDRSPITLFTFFLELPHALPMPPEPAMVTFDQRDEHWDGWSDDEVAQILTRESKNPFPSGFVPGTRIVVRHAEAIERPPLLLAEEAFADWIDPLFTEVDAAARRESRQEWRDSGLPVVRSVVALSRFLPRSAHPRGDQITVGWLLSQFRLALNDLNNVLEALGFVLGRWDVGAVALRDLPARIPVLIGATEQLSDGRPAGITFTASIHDAYPSLAGHFEPEIQSAEEAINLSNLARHGEQAYMLVFRLVHSAVGERLAGDLTRSVIDLNTAIEVLVSITINEGGPLVGLAQEEVNSANQAGLKKKVKKYLARVLGVEEIEIAEVSSTWGQWFGDGYQLRNEAVHEGASLAREDVDRAFEQAAGVIAELKQALEEREPLQALGKQLALDMRKPGPTIEDELLGISFPWD